MSAILVEHFNLYLKDFPQEILIIRVFLRHNKNLSKENLDKKAKIKYISLFLQILNRFKNFTVTTKI